MVDEKIKEKKGRDFSFGNNLTEKGGEEKKG